MCGGDFWGELLGKMQKRGGKTFLGECCGSCEPQKKKIFEKKKKILGGNFGGSTKGACDAVGMVRNEKKGKIFPPKNLVDFFRGGRIQGTRGTCGGGTAGK